MLVLTRRIGECLRVGDDIAVKVTNIDKDNIELCINGQEEVSICNEESISFKDDIKIKVVKIIKGQVKLGVDAPKDVIIKRGELYLNKQTIDLSGERVRFYRKGSERRTKVSGNSYTKARRCGERN